MHRRFLIAVGALIALAAPAATLGAQAQTGTSARQTRSASLHAVRALQARALVAAGLPARAVTAAFATPTSAATASLVLAAGDMNGDGVDDVLDARYRGVGPGERLVLFCRDGVTGSVRWRKIMPATEGHAYIPAPQLLGPQGLPGVVIVDVGSAQAGSTTTLS
ncbi:MAG TPA: hypothetical protein VH274_06465, partial [Mycobacteriales bacterium]|nr:hypothetical protein [Mycobacteriales bacterium]